MVLEVGVEACLAVLVGAQEVAVGVAQSLEHEVGALAGGVEVVVALQGPRPPRRARRSPGRSRRRGACRRGPARRAWRAPRRALAAPPRTPSGSGAVGSARQVEDVAPLEVAALGDAEENRSTAAAASPSASGGSPRGSRRRSGPPRPRSRRRGRSRSRPPGRASRAASSRASPRRRGGSARGRAPASRAGSRGRAARCRRASSRSGGRASRRRPSSGRSRRRPGRRCRRPASRRGSSRPARSRRGRAAAPAPGRRELGRASEAAAPRVGAAEQRLHRLVEEFRARGVRGGLDRRDRLQPGPRLRRPRPQLVAPAREGVDHRLHHHAEARHPAALVRREVGAAVEGHAVGVAEDRHRPAAAAGHRLHRLHVEGVDVGALLAVDLDVDEVLVHVGGGLGILEGLVLHHVAPVAGRVADREEDRAVFVAGARQRLLAPGVPVDRVVAVLKQVGAGLQRESIGHGSSLLTDRAKLTIGQAKSPKMGSRCVNSAALTRWKRLLV